MSSEELTVSFDTGDDFEVDFGAAYGRLVEKNITVNGTYTATDDGADGYSSVTVDIPSGASDVNFRDYDGTILYSYTASEAQALTALPSNPSHSGLTAQGWNWTLAQIQSQLASYPAMTIDVGQMYVTDDDTTRLYCEFEEGRLTPYLGICPTGTVVIDWGDGSSTDTLTGTSLTAVKCASHTYSSAGSYTIILTATSGKFGICGNANCSYLLRKANDSTSNVHMAYSSALRKVELGSSAKIYQYAFNYCSNLETITMCLGNSVVNYMFRWCCSLKSVTIPLSDSALFGAYAFQSCYSLNNITIPANLTYWNNYVFQSCYSLKNITIPANLTYFGLYAFGSCRGLRRITIPTNVKTIANYAFQNCYSLTSITIPSGVTSIGTSAFSACYSLGEIHFLSTTPPTVSASNAFSNVPTDCIIYVPTGCLSAYTSASNYPSSSKYTYVEE